PHPCTPLLYTLSLHDALPICDGVDGFVDRDGGCRRSEATHQSDGGQRYCPACESLLDAHLLLLIAVAPDHCHNWPSRSRRSYHRDRKSTRLNSSHDQISYAVF